MNARWTWNEDAKRFELHAGILRFYVSDCGGWWVLSSSLTCSVEKFASKEEAIDAAEELGYTTALAILFDLPE